MTGRFEKDSRRFRKATFIARVGSKLQKGTLLFMILLFASAPRGRASEQVPSAEALTLIENRAILLADYERAVTKATQLLTANTQNRYSAFESYIALKEKAMWLVFFGHIQDEVGAFLITNSFQCSDLSCDKMASVEDLKINAREIFELAKAAQLALLFLGVNFSDYDTKVFREKDRSVTVYVTPSSKKEGIELIGGDFKFSISPDASEIFTKTTLHKNILEVPMPSSGTNKVAGGFHTHVLNDLPTETDVAFILLNPQLAPNYIVGPTWMSYIDANGRIKVLGKTKEILEWTEENRQKHEN